MNQQAMLKKMRQMQQEIAKAQQEIEEMEIKESAGGIVSVFVQGTKEVIKVEISSDFTIDAPEDVEMLSDAITAACKRAYDRIEKVTEEKLGKYQALGAGSLF